ncbi:MAG: DUF4405 domain-containing protein [Candidatus Woesearchaeota archaeon]|jgi:cytochrome b subunit of formate dehydrogenase
MDKPKINYVIDMFLVISFVITAITGIIIFIFLPGGVRQGSYQEFLGITKSLWSGVHDYAGLTMIVLSLIHLILHWNWIIVMTKRIFKGEKD